MLKGWMGVKVEAWLHGVQMDDVSLRALEIGCMNLDALSLVGHCVYELLVVYVLRWMIFVRWNVKEEKNKRQKWWWNPSEQVARLVADGWWCLGALAGLSWSPSATSTLLHSKKSDATRAANSRSSMSQRHKAKIAVRSLHSLHSMHKNIYSTATMTPPIVTIYVSCPADTHVQLNDLWPLSRWSLISRQVTSLTSAPAVRRHHDLLRRYVYWNYVSVHLRSSNGY